MAALNAHDLERFEQLVAPHYNGADVSRERECSGAKALRGEMEAWLLAFPDFHLTVRDMLAEPPRVLVRWTMHGTHKGRFLYVPPTHRSVAVSGFSLLTVEEGCLARGLHLWDMAAMLRAMKLLPDLPHRRAGPESTFPSLY